MQLKKEEKPNSRPETLSYLEVCRRVNKRDCDGMANNMGGKPGQGNITEEQK